VFGQHLSDGRRERGLAMVNVTDGSNIHVRLIAIKFLFRHVFIFLAPRLFQLGWPPETCRRSLLRHLRLIFQSDCCQILPFQQRYLFYTLSSVRNPNPQTNAVFLDNQSLEIAALWYRDPQRFCPASG
jgi:hypothetical protein